MTGMLELAMLLDACAWMSKFQPLATQEITSVVLAIPFLHLAGEWRQEWWLPVSCWRQEMCTTLCKLPLRTDDAVWQGRNLPVSPNPSQCNIHHWLKYKTELLHETEAATDSCLLERIGSLIEWSLQSSLLSPLDL